MSKKRQPIYKNIRLVLMLQYAFFADPFALTAQDRIENGEYRWKTIGRIEGCLILLVAHTIVEDDNTETIRIISARRADSKERKCYEEFNR